MQIRAFWLHIFSSKFFAEHSYSMNDFPVKSIFLDSKGLYFLDRKVGICSWGWERLFMNPKVGNNMREIFKRLLVFGSSKPKTIIWSNFFLLIIFSELTSNRLDDKIRYEIQALQGKASIDEIFRLENAVLQE